MATRNTTPTANCPRCKRLREKLAEYVRQGGDRTEWFKERGEYGHKWWPMCSQACEDADRRYVQGYKTRGTAHAKAEKSAEPEASPEPRKAPTDLERDIFLPVAKRLRERADSLREMRRFPRSGIEAWLKVELIAALGDEVATLKNKGPDVLLRSGRRIELKGATDLNIPYLRDGSTKYGTPCIFLGDGRDRRRISQITGDGVKLVAHDIFSDGSSDWVVGLIVPEPARVAPGETI